MNDFWSRRHHILLYIAICAVTDHDAYQTVTMAMHTCPDDVTDMYLANTYDNKLCS